MKMDYWIRELHLLRFLFEIDLICFVKMCHQWDMIYIKLQFKNKIFVGRDIT